MSRKQLWILFAAVTVVIFVIVFVLRPESGPVDTIELAAPPPSPSRLDTEAFVTWQDYTTRMTGERERPRVVFIGVDGAGWNVIDPLIDAGDLPAFARLKQTGSTGILRSVECYVSPPSWAAMMTGYLPEDTGIHTFGHWDRAKNKFLPLASTDILVPSVWDVATAANRRSAVINVPLTYPVHDVDGIMVSGLLTPIQLKDRWGAMLTFDRVDADSDLKKLPRSHSPVLRSVFNHDANRLEFYLYDTFDDHATNYDRVRLDIRSGAPGSEEVVTHFFVLTEFSQWIQLHHTTGEKTEKVWCKMRVIPTEDPSRFIVNFSRALFATGDSDIEFTAPASIALELKKEFGYYFPSKFVDRRIVPSAAEDAVRFATYFRKYDEWDLFFYVFTQTDNIQHLEGASPRARLVYRTIDRFLGELMDDLPENTTLIVASDHGFKRYESAIDLNKFLASKGLLRYRGENDIDFEGSLVFHNLWCLYFNRKLLTSEALDERGIRVPRGSSPFEALEHHLRKICALITDGNGRGFPVELHDVPEEAAGFAPDMVVKGTYGPYLVEFWNIQRPRKTIVRQLGRDESWNHTREGIYAVWGSAIRRGIDAGTYDIQDIAPTILYLAGLPQAAGMAGRVMEGILTPAFAEHPRRIVGNYLTIGHHTIVTDKERESIEKHLRSLGYIR